MGFCSCTVKFLLFIFNLLCALVGLAILGASVYLYLQSNSVKDFVHGSVSLTFIIMMVLGAVTFIIAFLGCCGAVNEDPCCISTYATLLSIILVCQLVLAGWCVYIAKNSELEKEIRRKLEKEFSNYRENEQAVDFMQRALHCCGANGPSAWAIINLPNSCCPQKESEIRITDQISVTTCSSFNAYQAGCSNRLVEVVTGAGKNGAITLFVIAGVELLCIICAFCVANSIRRERFSGYAY